MSNSSSHNACTLELLRGFQCHRVGHQTFPVSWFCSGVCHIPSPRAGPRSARSASAAYSQGTVSGPDWARDWGWLSQIAARDWTSPAASLDVNKEGSCLHFCWRVSDDHGETGLGWMMLWTEEWSVRKNWNYRHCEVFRSARPGPHRAAGLCWFRGLEWGLLLQLKAFELSHSYTVRPIPGFGLIPESGPPSGPFWAFPVLLTLPLLLLSGPTFQLGTVGAMVRVLKMFSFQFLLKPELKKWTYKQWIYTKEPTLDSIHLYTRTVIKYNF